ncbi:radical SAM domain protein [Aggregatibacter actinomycetemcomitans serotype e str. SC1083]|uniref:Anaerobic ribonucleoside-triphosphate reductase-activating protein n=1 Tax=Aggregatibacter actinomycetemcomitans serotype e str. SC1083 TaxID=907488 RepID=G4A5J3_AGGAC|nr:4Fe-4S single cluster domain-containing protein [Aggregatibacter actinomycetemcomitans]EGY35383.1 radical SAM domain protein [Aggregatibacter actinomycetemcomitans serotype e str. SC1083]KYK76200.1 radical SAM protein [Aggregatibacter actinomycetemcomitans serotype e str. SA3096]KYK79254.1 radical SAM protein [Aggregatibacter actinomycetemcomitans serotype e str. SC936]
MHWLNIAHIIEATEAEGPGLRFVIWVQGCLKRCKGCCNGELLKIKPAHLMRSNEIIRLLQNTLEKSPLEGVTFLGGEPFLQAEGLADIAEAARNLDLSVMVFSGYEYTELLENKFSGSQRLLNFTDLLIDGEFDNTKIENVRNWVGSTNQKFHYLTNRYSTEIETRELAVTNEWRFNSNGQIQGNGLPFKIG